MLAIASAVLLAACGSSSSGAPATPPTAAVTATAAQAIPLPDREGISRWGYHPGRATGERDPPPVLSALPAGYRLETYVSGLTQPTSLAFTPDGRLLVAEQTGSVRLVEDGRLLPEPFYNADVYLPDRPGTIVELGLVGIAADPQFAQNGRVWLYYTAGEPERRTVLAHVREVDGRGRELEEVFSLDAAPECCHIAGSLRFAADGTLFVTVGDHQMETAAQDRSSPFGAVLHIKTDGSPADDNPFRNDPDADPRIYAYGLRNPFDVAVDADTGRVFATENGFLGQDAILEIVPGANYGWPGYELDVPIEQVQPPVRFYHQSIGPSGMELYEHDALPVFTGALLFCQFHQGGALHAISFNLDGSVAFDTIIAPGCTSDVTTGPDGFIYFLDYIGGVVYRIANGP